MPIIGGGPAGMSCALWLHNYGMHPMIIEKEGALGGMARLSPYPNEWLLGQRGKSGQLAIIPAGVKHGFSNIGGGTLHIQSTLAAPVFEAAYDDKRETPRRWLPA